MYMAVLIAPPGRLSADLAQNLAASWGAVAAPVWLSVSEAAEFTLAQLPDTRWQVWDDLQKMQVDLAIVPREGRRKKLLLADMDSTMIEQECIDELAEEAGFGAQVKEVTARAMNGELDFEDALRARVSLLKGLDLGVIDRVINDRISFMPGGAALVATMRAHGAYAALVSGGFTNFTSYVAGKLGFDSHRANRLMDDGQVLTGEVGTPILGRDAKVAVLMELTAAHDITPAEAIAVGDGANDLGMLGAAGMGVALHAKPAVAAQSELRINHGDLSALLYLQGYNRSEFVI